jgi:predicted metal-binding membrane protein
LLAAELRLTTLFLLGVAAICWLVTADRMDGMDAGPGTDLGTLGWFAGIWATMMAAMMLPSLVPMGAAYARAEKADDRPGEGRPFAATIAFVAGYLLTWLAFGLAAYAVIEGVSSLDLGVLAWDEAGPSVAGGVIAAAALYELTPMKAVALRHCRDPQLMVARRRLGPLGALRTGIEHGGFCVGSNWALTAALFALGVMSTGWMVLVAAVIAIEKLLPRISLASVGIVLLLAALAASVAFASDQVPGLTEPDSPEAMQAMEAMGTDDRSSEPARMMDDEGSDPAGPTDEGSSAPAEMEPMEPMESQDP